MMQDDLLEEKQTSFKRVWENPHDTGIDWLLGKYPWFVIPISEFTQCINGLHLSMDWFKGKFTGKPHI